MKKLFLIAAVFGTAASASAQNTFPATGNVGIGTTSPSTPLHVQSAISQNWQVWLKNAETSGHNLFFGYGNAGGPNDTNYGLYITGGRNVAGNFDLAVENKFYVMGNGYTGINTSAPRAALDVNGAAIISGPGNTLMLEKSTNHIPALTFKGQTGYSLIEAGDEYMTMSTGGNRRLTLLANGNLLVGKTAQNNNTYKLDIAGKVRADELVVNTTGADFVFEEGYQVRKLEELENFIKTNKHLPDIPPAKTMQEEGVGVSELQTKLLQKIEELTLYVIEQDKRLKEQSHKLAEQAEMHRKEIEALKSKIK